MALDRAGAIYALATPEVMRPSDPGIPHQLPARPNYFIDREELLTRLSQLLLPGKGVTLHGPAGIGRHALAAAALHRLHDEGVLRQRFPDGVILHNFYAEPAITQVFDHIVRSLGYDPQPNPAACARRALAGRRALLILLNAEKNSRLDLLRAASGSCGLLVTTQDPEVAGAHSLPLSALSPAAARKLLEHVAGPFAAPAEAVHGIAERLGHLPLSIALAGGFMGVEKVSAPLYLNWLRSIPAQVLEDNTQSVALLLTRTLDRVTPTAFQIMAVAGRLAPVPMNPDDFVAALGLRSEFDLRRPLADLASYNLIASRADGTFACAHPLIHSYCRIQLEPDPDVLSRLGVRYTRLADEAGEQGPSGYPILEELRPHVLALVPHLLEGGQSARVLYLAQAIRDFLRARRRTGDCLLLSREALSAASDLDRAYQKAFWLNALADAHADSGRFAEASEHYQRALTVARESDDTRHEASSLAGLGNLSLRLDRFEEAVDCHQRALLGARYVDDRAAEGPILGHLGIAHARLGQLEDGATHLRQALLIAREAADSHMEGLWLGNLGNIARQRGDPEEAIDHYQQALAAAEQAGDRGNQSTWLGNLALAFRQIGRQEAAQDSLHRALTLARESGECGKEVTWLYALANMYEHLGRVGEAIDHYQQALDIARATGDHLSAAHLLIRVGRLLLERGQVADASDHFRLALLVAGKVGDLRAEGNSLGWLGASYARAGQLREAVDHYRQALLIMRQLGDQQQEGLWLGRLGKSYAELGQTEEAVEHYRQAVLIARERGDRQEEVALLSGLSKSHLKLLFKQAVGRS